MQDYSVPSCFHCVLSSFVCVTAVGECHVTKSNSRFLTSLCLCQCQCRCPFRAGVHFGVRAGVSMLVCPCRCRCPFRFPCRCVRSVSISVSVPVCPCLVAVSIPVSMPVCPFRVHSSVCAGVSMLVCPCRFRCLFGCPFRVGARVRSVPVSISASVPARCVHVGAHFGVRSSVRAGMSCWCVRSGVRASVHRCPCACVRAGVHWCPCQCPFQCPYRCPCQCGCPSRCVHVGVSVPENCVRKLKNAEDVSWSMYSMEGIKARLNLSPEIPSYNKFLKAASILRCL